MACATLKRPLEWTDPSMSPPSAHNSGHKDSAHTYGHHARAAKRRCLTSMITPSINKETSHFGDVQPKLSSGLFITYYYLISFSFTILLLITLKSIGVYSITFNLHLFENRSIRNRSNRFAINLWFCSNYYYFNSIVLYFMHLLNS